MAAVTTQCWEKCFRNLSTEDNREVLSEIYKTGNAIKRIKDVNSAIIIAYLLDSTFARPCDSSSSHKSGDSSHFHHPGENVTSLWQLELQLMAIFASMSGSTRTFPVRYNEYASWSCSFNSCLDCCQTIKLVKSIGQASFTTNATCADGLLEPACRLGFYGITNYPCPYALVKNNMAVAILNSNAHSHVRKRGEYGDYSPCHTFFQHRYVVGIHNANHDDMIRFQSKEDYHNYISDGPKTRSVVQALFDCINTSCCPTVTQPPGAARQTAQGCNAAYGHTGETIKSINSYNLNRDED